MDKQNKLTRAQWDELNAQYERTPGEWNSFSASGEHYNLIAMLNRFGYFTHSRVEALNKAGELLAQGWKE